MNYIILDLEWDSVYCKAKGGFLNQIIQIGAVKLDESFNFVSSFEQVVKSSISKKLTRRFVELTGITTDIMKQGVLYSEAIAEYNNWVGTNIVTLTWSNSDLYAILENNKYFLPKNVGMHMELYADVQSYVQAYLREKGNKITNQISLSLAAEMLDVNPQEFALHTALDDSRLTASLLKKTFVKEKFEPFIKNTEDPEFTKRLTFKTTYVSKLNDPAVTADSLNFNCDVCGANAKVVKKWHFHNNWFWADFICPNCQNTFSARVMFKRTYNGIKITRRAFHKLPKEPELASTKEN